MCVCVHVSVYVCLCVDLNEHVMGENDAFKFSSVLNIVIYVTCQ